MDKINPKKNLPGQFVFSSTLPEPLPDVQLVNTSFRLIRGKCIFTPYLNVLQICTTKNYISSWGAVTRFKATILVELVFHHLV